MLALPIALAVIVIQTALATVVAVRAWDLRPARIFIFLSLNIIIVIGAAPVRDQATSVDAAYPMIVLLAVNMVLYLWLLMLVVAALFVPQWWAGRRPIVAISLPYLLVAAALTLDMIARLGIFTAGARFENGIYRLNSVMPGVVVLIVLALVGSLVPLAILGMAFVRRPEQRGPIILLFLAICFSIVFTQFVNRLPQFSRIGNTLQILPVVTVLGYLVLGTRLFTPTRAALDLALHAMSEAVAVIDRAGSVLYANPRAVDLGLRRSAPLAEALAAAGADAATLAQLDGNGHKVQAGSQQLILGGRVVQLSISSVADGRGQVQGTLLLARDITEVERRSAQLQHERAQLAETVRQLEAEQRERAQLVLTLQQLEAPVIPVLEGVLVLPLVGVLDTARIEGFTTALLQRIERTRTHTALIDITGVPLLDAAGAAGLLSAVQAARLLGTRCVLVGVRPEIAQALVALGAPLADLETAATLQQALLGEIRG